MTNVEGVLARARQFLFVRESAEHKNAGRWVEAIQRVGGTVKGQPWCCAFVSFVLGIWYDGVPPLAYTASCDVMLEEAKARHMVVGVPKSGDLFFVMKSANDATHVGFVAEVRAHEFSTIEGNGNPDGGREGFGVFARDGTHARALNGPYVFVRYAQ